MTVAYVTYLLLTIIVVCAQLYCLEWTDFRKHSLDTDLVPKIGAHTTEKIKELIRLEMQDRLLKSPRYKVQCNAGVIKSL